MHGVIIGLCFFFFFSLQPVLNVKPDFRHTGQHIVVKKLLANYNKEDIPEADKPIKVKLGIYVNSFYHISEQTMDYSVIMYLKQSWKDSRLKFKSPDGITHQMRMADYFWNKIWVPDVYFRNEKRAFYHKMTVSNRLLRINSTGAIYYSIKISATFSCPMRFEKYPLDTQVCPLLFESFGYTTNLMYFSWMKNPVDVDSGLELPQFTLVDHKREDCTTSYTTGNYSCIKIDFVLHRDIGYFIIQIYVPSMLIVILSWVSFWISIEAHPARVSLGLLTVLTTTTMSGGARESLPKVSYLKAMDIWMIVCLVFVFTSLLEYAIVNVIASNRIRSDPLKLGSIKRNIKEYMRKKRVDRSLEETKATDADKGRQRAQKVDEFSRKFFPTMFLIFNLFYWISYALPSKY